MLRRTFTSQTGIYFLSLFEKLSEPLRQFGYTVERLGNFMNYSYAFVSIFLFSKVFIHPSPHLSLALVASQKTSIVCVGLQAFLERFDHTVQETAESIAKFAWHCLQPNEFLKFFREVAASECVKKRF